MPSSLLLLCAYFPVAFLIYLMVKKKSLPASVALPLSAATVYLLCLFVFPFTSLQVHANVILGGLLSLTPVLIIGSAIFLFKVLDSTGAMEVIKSHLNNVSTNPVAQLVIVGWAFPFLIEGASGFGTPAALAAPILVGIGYAPLRVAVLVLVMNSVPVSFGAVGTPTWFGFAPLALSEDVQLTVGKLSALIHLVCSFVIPFIALKCVLSWQQIKANALYVLLCITATMLPFVAVSFFSYEFPSLIGGLIGLAASIMFAKRGVGLEKAATSSADSANASNIPLMRLAKASFPIWGTILVLIVTRLPFLPFKSWLSSPHPMVSFSIENIGRFTIGHSGVISWEAILNTQTEWSLSLLYIPAILPFWLVSFAMLAICKSSISEVSQVVSNTVSQMKKPLFALTGALIFVTLMMMGEKSAPVYLIGNNLANTFGGAWLFFAPFLGALGSFFSGSATISNLTFGAIQTEVASRTDFHLTLVLALQSVGAALGNMVCINNIVAVASVLGLHNAEGQILRKTVLPMLVYAVLAGVVATFLWIVI
ncbi:L-lactate permease [Alteromonas sp. 009811495]|uniref:L-lactate permease n=1 Tax=Alteromonas sp. 009811495 TaxID=3002962 RepID=UPI00237EA911|nr:L-lactate permease [Alteromonas sp. 009811495]WDT87528.1 L-lactate permease [Alteromonas sp. 009811495]